MIVGQELFKVIEAEAEALQLTATRVDHKLEKICRAIADLPQFGVITTGVGKAGIVAQKVAATMSSLSIPATFLDPTSALHGDLGGVNDYDTVLAFSHSGETLELEKLLPHLAVVYLITGAEAPSLSKWATATFSYGPILEADPRGLAPTSSTTVMMAIGDALALTIAKLRDFKREDYAMNHPGGSLGAASTLVKDVMKDPLSIELKEDANLSDWYAYVSSHLARNHAGLACIIQNDEFCGVVSIADAIRKTRTMAENCVTLRPDSSVGDAMRVMKERKINQIPVLDNGDVVGIIEIQDIVGLGLDV